MSIGAIIGAVAGIGGSLLSSKGSDKAVREQKAAYAAMEARLNAATGEMDEATQAYMKELDTISSTFNPFDIQAAYDSIYEAVIVPLERDYAEYVLPSVQAAYSGGVYGEGTAQSGARKEAEARSRRDVSKQKSQAIATERETAINRNMAMDARQREIAKEKLGAATLVPQMKANQAVSLYQGQQDTIATSLAAKQAKTQAILQAPYAAAQGSYLGGIAQKWLSGSEVPKNEWDIIARLNGSFKPENKQ